MTSFEGRTGWLTMAFPIIMNRFDSVKLEVTMIFKIRKLRTFCVTFLILIALLVTLFVVAKMREQTGLQLVILLVFMPLLLLSGFVAILSLMDIVITERAISRNFLGRVWQSVEWNNVRIIKVFDDPNRTGGKITYVNIFPLEPPKFRILPSGKIVFNDEWMDDFEKCKSLMNGYIRSNDIAIERRIKGKLVLLNQI